MLFIQNYFILNSLNNIKKNQSILSNTKNIYSFYKILLTKFINNKINKLSINLTSTFFKKYFYFLEFEKQLIRLHYRFINNNNLLNYQTTRTRVLSFLNLPIVTVLLKYYARSSFINNSRLSKYINKVFNNNIIINNKYYLYKYQSSYSKKNKFKRRYRRKKKIKHDITNLKLYNKYNHLSDIFLKYIRYNTSFLKNNFSFVTKKKKDLYKANNNIILLSNDLIFSNVYLLSHKKLFFLKRRKHYYIRNNFNYRKYIAFFRFIIDKAKHLFNCNIKYNNNVTLFNDMSLFSYDNEYKLHENYLNNNSFYYNNFIPNFYNQNKNMLYFFLSRKKVSLKSHLLSNIFNFFFSINKNRFLLKKNLYFFLNLNTLGIVHFKNTLRNIFITISTHSGKHLYHISSGYVKSLGRKKTSNRTIYNLTRKFLLKLNLILRANNMTHIRLIIQGHFNNIFVFVKPFLKKFYARNKIHNIFKNYIFFFKKYILFLKRSIIRYGSCTSFNLNKYILLIMYCSSINIYLKSKTNKFLKFNIKLLNIQMISNKFFSSR
jgi:hypothetical protein